MDRADGASLSVAVAFHVVLFGVLSLNVPAPPEPVPPPPMEVSFVDGVVAEPAAPAAEAMPAAEVPEIGPALEAMPNAAPVAEPLPPPPPVELAPPPPAPAPVAVKPPPPKPKPVPVPKPVPAPKPVAAKPVPIPKPKPVSVKAASAKPAPAKAKPVAAKADASSSSKAAPTKPASAKPKATTGLSGNGQKTAATAPRLGKNFLAGLSDPSPGKADKPVAAVAPAISADAMAGIQSAIKRQIQPCANRQVNPGPGASRILVKLNLKLNRDGSLASAPRVVSTSGVDDENSRYEKRVADLAIAAYTGCAPMRGLPVDLYRTAKGGWSNVNMNYKLPG